MELRQLKYFAAVAKYLNFSEAADHLYVTQGTLSQQIKQLEDELGVSLFHRTSRSVVLTDAGEEMLPLANKVLESAYDCHLKISDLKNVLTGTLNIGLTSSFKELATDTMRSFLKAYPGVKMTVHSKTANELLGMLERREIDLMLAFKPTAKYDEVESEPLFESVLSVIMRKGHPLSDRKSLSLKDLKFHYIVLPGAGLQARKKFERFVNVDTSELNVHAVLDDPNTILDLLRGSDMISVLSSLAIRYDQSLVAIPLDGVESKMIGCVHWLKGFYKKKSAMMFVEMLRDSAMIQRIGSLL